MWRCVPGFVCILAAAAVPAAAQRAPNVDLISVSEPQVPGVIASQAWANRRIKLKVLNQDVRAVLTLIAAEAKVPVAVDQAVAAPVLNLNLDGTVPAALDRLAEAAGLVWWWNGSEVRVVDRRDVQSRIWTAGDPSQVRQLVRDIGVPDGAVQLQEAGDAGMLRVVGPRALLTELEPVVKTMAARASQVRVTRHGKTTVEKPR